MIIAKQDLAHPMDLGIIFFSKFMRTILVLGRLWVGNNHPKTLILQILLELFEISLVSGHRHLQHINCFIFSNHVRRRDGTEGNQLLIVNQQHFLASWPISSRVT